MTDADASVPGRLIVLSGLPGVGKTSIGAAFAGHTGALQLSIDAVEEAMLASGLPPGWHVGVAAYEAVGALAVLNLRLGRTVAVDAVNDREAARQTWRSAAAQAGSRLDFVHLVIRDAREHERRLRGRDRGFAHVGEPSWADVLDRRASYAAWTEKVIEMDTSAQAAPALAAALAERLSHNPGVDGRVEHDSS